ncbi:hypothetical protein ACFX2G_041550 [Malus domestica]
MLKQAITLSFKASNNEAGYEAPTSRPSNDKRLDGEKAFHSFQVLANHQPDYQGQRHDDHGNRLLHQISRSRAHDDHGSDGHRAFHMKKYHLSIWHPLIHCHRQLPVIRGQRFGEVLPKIWHQAAHVYAKISSRQ